MRWRTPKAVLRLFINLSPYPLPLKREARGNVVKSEVHKQPSVFTFATYLVSLAVVIASLALPACSSQAAGLTVFAGSAQKPALEEVARAFEQQTSIKVQLNLGGSGMMLSQMKLSRRGDLYIPASPDFMSQAAREGLVDPRSVRRIAYLTPAILVPKGNPQNILALSDLAKPGLTLAIANPQSVSVGLYAVEVLERSGLLKPARKNIITYTESAEKLATILVLKQVDAVIGWSVMANWYPQEIEAIYLKPEQLPRIAYYSAAITTYTDNKETAQGFLDFLTSAQARAIYSKWGHIVTEAEARKLAPQAEIGGEYHLPLDFNP